MNTLTRTKLLANLLNLKSAFQSKTLLRHLQRPFSATNTRNHDFQIYKKIYPNLGNPPAAQEPPQKGLVKVAPPEDMHYKFDFPPSKSLAIQHNYEIRREPVSSYYSLVIGNTKYYVFNAARYVSISKIATRSDSLQGGADSAGEDLPAVRPQQGAVRRRRRDCQC